MSGHAGNWTAARRHAAKRVLLIRRMSQSRSSVVPTLLVALIRPQPLEAELLSFLLLPPPSSCSSVPPCSSGWALVVAGAATGPLDAMADCAAAVEAPGAEDAPQPAPHAAVRALALQLLEFTGLAVLAEPLDPPATLPGRSARRRTRRRRRGGRGEEEEEEAKERRRRRRMRKRRRTRRTRRRRKERKERRRAARRNMTAATKCVICTATFAAWPAEAAVLSVGGWGGKSGSKKQKASKRSLCMAWSMCCVSDPTVPVFC